MLGSDYLKSSYSFSNSNCVEARYRKAGASHLNGGCVEVADGCGEVHVRDSKDPDGPVLTFPPSAWRPFLASLGREA